MKTHLLPAGILLLALSCNQQPKVVVTKKAYTISAKQKPDSPKYVQEAENEKIDYPDTPPDHGWIDSLLTAYVKNSGNELVSMSVADTSINEQWLFDSIRQRGESKYFIYNVGHDNIDDEIAVFVSDSWVYIDTLTRKLYEGQPDESLKEWKP